MRQEAPPTDQQRPRRFSRSDLASIAEAIRSGCQEVGLLSDPKIQMPLPHDIGAEEELVSGLLAGAATPLDFEGLEPKHFENRFLGACFAAAGAIAQSGERPAIDDVVEALGRQGYRSPDIRKEVETLEIGVPLLPEPTLRRNAERIFELYQRRELIRLMSRLDSELRADLTTHADACARLRRAIEGHG
jgi:hypothetical protein